MPFTFDTDYIPVGLKPSVYSTRRCRQDLPKFLKAPKWLTAI